MSDVVRLLFAGLVLALACITLMYAYRLWEDRDGDRMPPSWLDRQRRGQRS